MVNDIRSIHLNALPNYQNAVILREKLEGYSLNPGHPVGKHHALVFKSALLKKDFEYGRLFEVVMLITGPNGHTTDVLTAWIIRIGTDFPFLVTTYVNVQ